MAYSLRTYAIFPHFSHCYSSVVLRVGISTAEIPAHRDRIGWRSKTPNAKQRKRAVFVGHMGPVFRMPVSALNSPLDWFIPQTETLPNVPDAPDVPLLDTALLRPLSLTFAPWRSYASERASAFLAAKVGVRGTSMRIEIKELELHPI